MSNQIQVTFNKAGNHISKQMWRSEEVTLKDNYVFSATLRYVGWHAGRSSAIITWTDDKGKLYQSGMQMLDQVLHGDDCLNSFGLNSLSSLFINGDFTFKKVGTVVLLSVHKP